MPQLTLTLNAKNIKEQIINHPKISIGLVLNFLLIMLLTPKVPQPKSYHDFADQRSFFGIPHTINVVSNLPFLWIGIAGLAMCYYKKFVKISLEGEIWGWRCFFLGITLVAFGSAFYHLNPNDDRLVWDRLPIGIAQGGIVAVFVIERIDEKRGILTAIPFIFSNMACILYWWKFDDLRPFGMAECVTLLAIVLMSLVVPAKYTHSSFWVLAAGLYSMARFGETFDNIIYSVTFKTVSGHTLKHFFLSAVPHVLALMLALREFEIQKISLLEKLKNKLDEFKERAHKD